jgi:hypothetical protein
MKRLLASQKKGRLSPVWMRDKANWPLTRVDGDPFDVVLLCRDGVRPVCHQACLSADARKDPAVKPKTLLLGS